MEESFTQATYDSLRIWEKKFPDDQSSAVGIYGLGESDGWASEEIGDEVWCLIFLIECFLLFNEEGKSVL